MFNLVRLPKIGSSDHYTILTKPKSKTKAKPVIKKIKIRDTRDSAWCAFGRWIVNKDWSSITLPLVKINMMLLCPSLIAPLILSPT